MASKDTRPTVENEHVESQDREKHKRSHTFQLP
uniref:Uncharacterized protein n=1 Tax=Anguilla anguilla TaxID=7936 RepID=A0A0E9UBU5_ANGAN